MPTPIRASFPEQNSSASVGLTTIHKFENGTTGNLSLSTFLLLLKVVGQINSLDDLLPELPESFYLIFDIRKDGQPVTSNQVYAVICRYPDTFTKAEGRIMLMI